MQTDNQPHSKKSSFLPRVAAAPISWGVCEVPGWGFQLPPKQVLAEMKSLGFPATEYGAEGWLPQNLSELQQLLRENDLGLLGAFVPTVLHDPESVDVTLHAVEKSAKLLAACGARYFIDAPLMSFNWSSCRPLTPDEWEHLRLMVERVSGICEEYSLEHVIHEHHGTIIETKQDVKKLLEISDVKFVLDTGHLAIGGFDPFEFAQQFPDRVGLVHLKDSNESMIKQLNSGHVSLMEAVRKNIFRPLGQGDLPIKEIVNQLETWGYEGWYVIEQDSVIEDQSGESPIKEVEASLQFLQQLEHDLQAQATKQLS